MSTNEASVLGRGKYRIWWIPQIPMKGFHYFVQTLVEAKTLLDALAHYDLFQLANNIKPDYANAGGLEVNSPKYGWEEWEDEEGDGIDDISYERALEIDLA